MANSDAGVQSAGTATTAKGASPLLPASVLQGDQIELLAILHEELAEAGQVISKILRHGYQSHNPVDPNVVNVDGEPFPNNRDLLEKEIGHVFNAINMMVKAAEIEPKNIESYAIAKAQSIGKWLHFPQVGFVAALEKEKEEVLTGVKALVAKLR